MNKVLIGLLLAMSALSALAARAETYSHNNQQITKLQAIRKLIENENATILRCNEVMLTDKATLKNRPKLRQ